MTIYRKANNGAGLQQKGNTMRATFTKPGVTNGKHFDGKELVAAYSVVGTIRGEQREIVTARCYMGHRKRSSVVYASLWVHGDGNANYCSGHGSAGGWGYHKESAAIGDAIASAGIELFGDVYNNSYRYNHAESREYTPAETKKLRAAAAKKRAYINGVGDTAIRDALLAIAKAAGGRGKLFIVQH